MYMYYNWKMKLFILVSLVKYQVQLFTIISYIYISGVYVHEKQNYEARWINFLLNFNRRKRFYINETIKIPIFPRARICERE